MAPDKEVQYKVPEMWNRCEVGFEGVKDPETVRTLTANVLRNIGGTNLVDNGKIGYVTLERLVEEPLQLRLATTLELLRTTYKVAICFS